MPAVTSKKLVIVGDGMVGKTALLQSFVQGKYEGDYTPTVFETSAEEVHLPDGRSVTLSLWDTGGQEEFDQIRQLAYPGAAVVILCYAIDCQTSLHNVVHTWNGEVRHFCPTSPIILVGCKSDLRHGALPLQQTKSAQRTEKHDHLVDPEEASAVQQQIGALIHLECSAVTRANVKSVFQLAAMAVLNAEKANRPRMFGSFSGKSAHSKQGSKRCSSKIKRSKICCFLF
ncbi:unnamed protein product [Schistocephalus solidus]|uniref:Ras-like GTP-binding protein rhoA n=1 Tax=Schistocephalus solidus TaxID=70667 RepID=A0A0X3Q4A0_SCHSO|nr:unnamed protein product [Schistocephalus solidus]